MLCDKSGIRALTGTLDGIQIPTPKQQPTCRPFHRGLTQGMEGQDHLQVTWAKRSRPHPRTVCWETSRALQQQHQQQCTCAVQHQEMDGVACMQAASVPSKHTQATGCQHRLERVPTQASSGTATLLTVPPQTMMFSSYRVGMDNARQRDNTHLYCRKASAARPALEGATISQSDTPQSVSGLHVPLNSDVAHSDSANN